MVYLLPFRSYLAGSKTFQPARPTRIRGQIPLKELSLRRAANITHTHTSLACGQLLKPVWYERNGTRIHEVRGTFVWKDTSGKTTNWLTTTIAKRQHTHSIDQLNHFEALDANYARDIEWVIRTNWCRFLHCVAHKLLFRYFDKNVGFSEWQRSDNFPTLVFAVRRNDSF